MTYDINLLKKFKSTRKCIVKYNINLNLIQMLMLIEWQLRCSMIINVGYNLPFKL